MDALVNGVTTGGVTRSVKKFYQEASYGNFDISASVFGPVSLSGTFDDYFNADGTTKDGFHQACFTAADSLIDYNNFDTLLCVSQHVPGPPSKFAWPYSSIGNWGPYTTAEGNKNYGVISMPNDWETLDGRRPPHFPNTSLDLCVDEKRGGRRALEDPTQKVNGGRSRAGPRYRDADQPHGERGFTLFRQTTWSAPRPLPGPDDRLRNRR